MENQEAGLGKREAQMKAWGAKLDQLSAKVDAVGADVKLDYRKGIDDLKVSYKDTQAKYDAFKVAGKEDAAIIQSGFEKAWHELEAAFKKL